MPKFSDVLNEFLTLLSSGDKYYSAAWSLVTDLFRQDGAFVIGGFIFFGGAYVLYRYQKRGRTQN